MPGVVIAKMTIAIGLAIEQIEFLAVAGRPEDCEDQVLYLPL